MLSNISYIVRPSTAYTMILWPIVHIAPVIAQQKQETLSPSGCGMSFDVVILLVVFYKIVFGREDALLYYPVGENRQGGRQLRNN